MTDKTTSARGAPGPGLHAEQSAYLRQHADQPVPWWPWVPAAFESAVSEDRPILLSIGYSACHWCHVMAHESFDDPKIAEMLANDFVCIKVDREERPDVDAIYQKVVQLQGEGGGWPLTVFLMPDGRPFHGGTYYPPQSRWGKPGFAELLTVIARAWKDRRDDVEKAAASFAEGLADLSRAEPLSGPMLDSSSIAEAAKRALLHWDRQHGGLGSAPKFPHAPVLALWHMAGSEEALHSTLRHMWRGGIYDHLRGGFARYSVDRKWLVPHFEKMLYDNALLLGVYAAATARFKDDHSLRAVVRETIDYLGADMRAPQGAFYSATDADSEGEEGLYFAWTPGEIDTALGSGAGRFLARYGVTQTGNFEHGRSILNLPDDHDLPSHDAAGQLLDREEQRAKEILLGLRSRRIPPLRDEKIIMGWNALLISGLLQAADAAELWPDTGLAARSRRLAEQALDFLERTHRLADGRFARVSYDGEVKQLSAMLDDVAALGVAALDLHAHTLDLRWLELAERAAVEIAAEYAGEGQELVLTPRSGETLLESPSARDDGPTPSGHGLSIALFARLEGCGRLSSEGAALLNGWLEQHRGAASHPTGRAAVVLAVQWRSEGATYVKVRAPRSADGLELARAARLEGVRHVRNVQVHFEVGEGEVDAIVCRGGVCTMPMRAAEQVVAAMGGGGK